MREEINPQYKDIEGTLITQSAVKSLSKLQDAEKTDFKSSPDFDKAAALFRYGSGKAKVSFAELLDSDDNPVIDVEFYQEVKIKIYFIQNLI